MGRSWRPLVVMAITILVMAMAAAGSGQASNPNTVTAVNKISVDINQSLNIEFFFRPGTLHIQRGATLTFRQGPPQPPFAFPEGVDPHTLSIVRRADLPQTLREGFECEVCGPFLEAHDLEGASPTFVVNVGKAGLNQPGDSLLITDAHPVTTAPVTAPAGTTLHYLCAVHSWMQGKLVVE